MVAAVRAHINRRLVDEIDDDTSEEPDVTEDQNVDATEKALDTTYNVNNYKMNKLSRFTEQN